MKDQMAETDLLNHIKCFVIYYFDQVPACNHYL